MSQETTRLVATGSADSTAEEKRLAARRRFLAHGAAQGSSLLIVTLVHQRAFAGTPGSKSGTYQPQGKLMSAALCASIGGHAANREKLYVLDPNLNRVEQVDCVASGQPPGGTPGGNMSDPIGGTPGGNMWQPSPLGGTPGGNMLQGSAGSGSVGGSEKLIQTAPLPGLGLKDPLSADQALSGKSKR